MQKTNKVWRRPGGKVSTGNYIFKVALGKGVWRNIKIASKHTLLDLHDAIQSAFDFADDHLYAFFMDGKKYSDDAYNSPMEPSGRTVDRVTIGNLNLATGQQFMYLFDYGDEWTFNVKLIEIASEEASVKAPKVVEKKGAAPLQYADFDDGDE